MFTGIIRELGIIKKIQEKDNLATFTVKAPKTLRNKKIGESIAVNGVCVTIIEIKNDEFRFDAIDETIERSNLSDLRIGDSINLEPALKLNESLDGHIVQGHVDTVAPVTNVQKTPTQTTISIKLLPEIKRYIAMKGSITINGVSLTVSNLEKNNFSVALIPHTLQQTNLQNLKKGDNVNLEIDIIARYLEKMI